MSSGSVRRVLSVAMAPAAASLSAARGLGAVAASFPLASPQQQQQKKQAHGIAQASAVPARSARQVHSLAARSGRPAGSLQAVSGSGASLKAVFGGAAGGTRRNGIRPAGVRCEATVAEREEAPPAAQKFEYQAEVSRLLKLIVHSLYSHKEVFLRELVSNASDALDKLRFLSVTDQSLLAANPNMEIRIKADRDAGTITITDSGIGMTREELQESLGTIAQSGTARFLNALKESKDANTGDNNLIGQFGVGFYSAFLVADKVVVRTKSVKSDKQYVWEGEADTSSYTIREEDEEDKLLPRGTSVTLYLKDDDKFEYSDSTRLANLVKNYSQFISFPIYTWQEKTRQVEVEDEGPVEEGAEKKEKTKKTEKYFEWEMGNETKPIWMRSPKEVPKEEYDTFYKNTFKDFVDPMAYTHFTTEGEIEFKSLLYIPGMAPFGDEAYNQKTKNIRLYVKRVFISNEFDGELFPRYLGFIKGVVDSNDLPLNVSREILQESRIVRIMKKRLVRKAFDMIDDIAKRENGEDYKNFWTNFGKNLKLGCVEDQGNHKKIAPLLRFFSSKSGENLISLDGYIGTMKPEQKAIYYLASDSIKSAQSAPFLEALDKKGYEVLFLIEPIDEVAITNVQEYKDKKFVDISKEDLDLGDEEDKKEMEKEYRLLTDWMKQILGDKVAKVQISTRLSSAPCVLVSGKFGWSANMERIMKAQALGDTSTLEFMKGRRILEINPDHPIIKDLNVACRDTPRNDRVRGLVDLLYETSLLSCGFTPENPADFGTKIFELMGSVIGKQEAGAVEEYTEEPRAAASEGAAEVVEPSEVRTDNDPWKS